MRMAAAKTEPERRRTRTSIRSYVVQAGSVVAPWKMRFYEDLNLPQLDRSETKRSRCQANEAERT